MLFLRLANTLIVFEELEQDLDDDSTAVDPNTPTAGPTVNSSGPGPDAAAEDGDIQLEKQLDAQLEENGGAGSGNTNAGGGGNTTTDDGGAATTTGSGGTTTANGGASNGGEGPFQFNELPTKAYRLISTWNSSINLRSSELNGDGETQTVDNGLSHWEDQSIAQSLNGKTLVSVPQGTPAPSGLVWEYSWLQGPNGEWGSYTGRFFPGSAWEGP